MFAENSPRIIRKLIDFALARSLSLSHARNIFCSHDELHHRPRKRVLVPKTTIGFPRVLHKSNPLLHSRETILSIPRTLHSSSSSAKSNPSLLLLLPYLAPFRSRTMSLAERRPIGCAQLFIFFKRDRIDFGIRGISPSRCISISSHIHPALIHAQPRCQVFSPRHRRRRRTA